MKELFRRGKRKKKVGKEKRLIGREEGGMET